MSVSGLGRAGEIARSATARDQQDCVFDETVETTQATGFPGFDSYELQFNDNNGDNDEGELDELSGGAGGHDVCDANCQYEPLSLYHPPAPKMINDEFDGSVYWSYYNVTYSEDDDCNGNCWDDDNDEGFARNTQEYPYFCGIE